MLLAHPTAGHWLFTPEAGSTISKVGTATMLPAPSVRVHLTGHAYAWKLHYKIKPISGQKVQFLETFGKVTHPIATVTAARGTISFTPAGGPGGRRTIVAQVIQGISPRARMTVAHYTVPPVRPLAPSRVKARRSGSSLVITWHGRGVSSYYVVIVHETAGAIRELISHKDRVVFKHLPAYSGATVKVAGASLYGAPGPATSVVVSKPSAPKAVHGPKITGKDKLGATLTCVRGTWTGSPHFVTQWLDKGIPIVSATKARFKVSRSLAHAVLACEITARNAAGFTTKTSRSVRVP